jgi:mutator protein MutT
MEKDNKLRDTTLVYLIKKSGGKISEMCLAMKKRGFGMNRWNGVGGKLEKGESVFEAAVRETREEIGVEIKQSSRVAELDFFFSHHPDWNQKVHVYFSETWEGEPSESEEMKPQWFSLGDLPFNKMWPDDEFWFPEVLSGKLVRATFTFGEGDIIQNKEVKVVKSL